MLLLEKLPSVSYPYKGKAQLNQFLVGRTAEIDQKIRILSFLDQQTKIQPNLIQHSQLIVL